MAKQKVEKAIMIGSVVQLKSGGPDMVVVSATSGVSVSVVLTVLWAAKDDRIAKADIVIQALRLIRQ